MGGKKPQHLQQITQLFVRASACEVAIVPFSCTHTGARAKAWAWGAHKASGVRRVCVEGGGREGRRRDG